MAVRTRDRNGRKAPAAASVAPAVAQGEPEPPVVRPHYPGVADVLFAVSPLLTGAGLITAGLVIIRADAGTGRRRWLPLALGLYTLFVLVPVMIGSGGPPAPAALWTIAGWDLLWLLVAATVLARTRSDGSAPRSRAASPRVIVR